MKKETEKPILLADIGAMIPSSGLRFFYGLIRFPFEALTGIRKLNRSYARILRKNPDPSPQKFIDAVSEELGVSYLLPDPEALEPYRTLRGPIVVVSNHPFGGLEALPLIKLLGAIRGEFKIMSNILLEQIGELRVHLLSVNPYDNASAKRQNMNRMRKILNYLDGGGMLSIFPSGEVSSFHWSEKKVTDPPWNRGVGKIIEKSDATVIPLYFHGRNSLLFQLVGFLHPYIRTVFLLREFLYPRTSPIRYVLGAALKVEDLKKKKKGDLSEILRQETYALRNRLAESKAPCVVVGIEGYTGKEKKSQQP